VISKRKTDKKYIVLLILKILAVLLLCHSFACVIYKFQLRPDTDREGSKMQTQLVCIFSLLHPLLLSQKTLLRHSLKHLRKIKRCCDFKPDESPSIEGHTVSSGLQGQVVTQK